MTVEVTPPRTYFDVRDFGAVGNGVADDTTAISAAITAATGTGTNFSTSGGGTVLLPQGTWAISGPLSLTNWVNLVGLGVGVSVLKATSSTARITCASSWERGQIEHLAFNGNSTATIGLYMNAQNGATVRDLYVTGCTTAGVSLHNVQNSVFENVNTELNSGSGMVVDDGCGSNVFIRCESNDNTKHQLLITDTDTESSGYDQPTQNVFIACLTEHQPLADSGTATGGSTSTLVDSGKAWATNSLAGAWVTKDPGGAAQGGVRIISNTSTTLTVESGVWGASPSGKTYRIHWPCVRIDASDKTLFVNHIISPGATTPGEHPLLHMTRKGGTESIAAASIQNSVITGSNSYHTSVEFDGSGGNVRLDFVDPNNSAFTGAKVGFRVQSGAGSQVRGSEPTMNSVTTPATFVSGSRNSMFIDFKYGTQTAFTAYATTDRVEYVVVSGESGARSIRYGDGTYGINDGSDFTEDISFSRPSANTARVTASSGLQVTGPVAPQNTAALIYSGANTPEGAVTAAVGSIFLRTNGGAGTSIYVKESGSGNTGWVGK